MLTVWSCVMALCCRITLASMKSEYVIGGWVPGETDIFLKLWKPVFETYLTESVGREFDPPISFHLMAVDQTKQSTTGEMVNAGKIDFLCE